MHQNTPNGGKGSMEASKRDWPSKVDAATNDPDRIERRRRITPGVTVRRRG